MKDTRPTCYISIPITGKEKQSLNYFIDMVKDKIEGLGYRPVSPLDSVTDYTLPWLAYMIDDLKVLGTCDYVWFADDWMSSTGCRIERLVAEKLKIPYILLDTSDIPPVLPGNIGK